jgi:hypothetical protein
MTIHRACSTLVTVGPAPARRAYWTTTTASRTRKRAGPPEEGATDPPARDDIRVPGSGTVSASLVRGLTNEKAAWRLPAPAERSCPAAPAGRGGLSPMRHRSSCDDSWTASPRLRSGHAQRAATGRELTWPCGVHLAGDAELSSWGRRRQRPGLLPSSRVQRPRRARPRRQASRGQRRRRRPWLSSPSRDSPSDSGRSSPSTTSASRSTRARWSASWAPTGPARPPLYAPCSAWSAQPPAAPGSTASRTGN